MFVMSMKICRWKFLPNKKTISDEFEEMLIISASIEADINDLETEDDKKILNDLGLTEPGVNKVIRSAFNLHGLQTFLLLVKRKLEHGL